MSYINNKKLKNKIITNSYKFTYFNNNFILNESSTTRNL